MLKDLQFAARALTKRIGFTIIVVATLALGLGLNTAMFSLMNAIYLRPLPFHDQASLIRIYRTTPASPQDDISPGDFKELKAAEGGIGEIAGSFDERVALAGDGHAASLQFGYRTSPGYFGVLGVRPELGRLFTPNEEALPNPGVVIISHALWRTRFGGDPGAVGRLVRIDGVQDEVIGVLPESADDGRVIRGVDVFRPLGFGSREWASREGPMIKVIGRLSPSTSDAQAGAFAAALGARLAREFPKDDGGAVWRVAGLQGAANNQSGRVVVLMLLGLSGFVLLIACSNLANFVLARTIERSPELAVRSALGASRFQLVRPLAIESLLLAAAGGAAALPVAAWATRWLNEQGIASGGSPMQFPMDWRVLGFALTLSLATALVFGAAPAYFVARLDVYASLKRATRGATPGAGHQRMRRLLVVGQFAMAMTLLAGAGALYRGAGNLVRERVGWESENVVVGTVSLPQSRYDGPGKIIAFQARLAERLRALPGADSAAFAYTFPFEGTVGTRRYLVEGRAPVAKGQEPEAAYDGVSPEFFRVTQTRLLAGRAFTDADGPGSQRVAIVNLSMARELFGGESPLGRRIAVAGTEKADWAQVVGVVADVRPAEVYRKPVPFQVYTPFSQEPWQDASYAIRCLPGAAKPMIGEAARTVASLDMDLPVRDQMSADDSIVRSTFDLGMFKKMLGAFAVLGLALASLGIYGVVARTVAQRTGEIGVRMALGATMANVRNLILMSGLRLAVAGMLVGMAGGLGLARLLGSTMPAVDGSPAPVVAAAGAVLALVALAASYAPARAASRVDPISAIRAE